MAELPSSFVLTWAFVLGAVVGSFLNVLIYRLPRDLSVVRPRSSCPACGRMIRWYDNVPVLSWLMLRGRCRACGAWISLRYPAVELASAGLAVAVVLRYGQTLTAIEVGIFAWVTLALALIDLEHQLLPDVLTIPSIVLGLGLSWLGGLTTIVDSALGAVIGAALPALVIGIYYLLRGIEGMGWGDVKYLAAIGAVVGVEGCLWVLVVGSVVGAVLGGILIALKRGSSRTALPFGTFLAVAVLLYLLLPGGWRLLQLY
jgi:leader peptidase (prepilin peptidase)/N-methyltransferase